MGMVKRPLCRRRDNEKTISTAKMVYNNKSGFVGMNPCQVSLPPSDEGADCLWQSLSVSLEAPPETAVERWLFA